MKATGGFETLHALVRKRLREVAQDIRFELA